MLTGYAPVFTSFEGSVYEMELTRAAIHAFATHVSKLKPEVTGPGNQTFQRMLQYQPNPWSNTSQYLYRLATIYSVQNNAFIAPIYADDMDTLTGYFPLLPQRCEILDVQGIPYIRYTFTNGQHAAEELSRVGMLNQFQYKDDLFGENNQALYPTMQLIQTQNQGIIEGVKNSAGIRFVGKIGQTLKGETLDSIRTKFREDNLSAENNGGIILTDNKIQDLKQIDSTPFVVNAAQMKQIQENVYNYFGCNAAILQNSFDENQWNAYYEGKIEPFAIQLSLAMTNMTFSQREIAYGNEIVFTANRLQYASNNTKISIVQQMFDRGMITMNQGLEIFNMAPVEGGDKRYIRKEYTQVTNLDRVPPDDPGGAANG